MKVSGFKFQVLGGRFQVKVGRCRLGVTDLTSEMAEADGFCHLKWRKPIDVNTKRLI